MKRFRFVKNLRRRAEDFERFSFGDVLFSFPIISRCSEEKAGSCFISPLSPPAIHSAAVQLNSKSGSVQKLNLIKKL